MSLTVSSIILGVLLAVCIITLILVVAKRVNSRGPRNRLKEAAQAFQKTLHPYQFSSELDASVLKLKGAQFSKYRLLGDFLQTWQLDVTQETILMAMKTARIDLARPLLLLSTALKTGDMIVLNDACAQLTRLPFQTGREIVISDWKSDLIDKLKKIADHVDKGERSGWHKAISLLVKDIDGIPLKLRPAIYLLKGYLDQPIKYTEVCINPDTISKQTKSLAKVVMLFAEEIEKPRINPEKLWNILGTYGEQYRLPAY